MAEKRLALAQRKANKKGSFGLRNQRPTPNPGFLFAVLNDLKKQHISASESTELGESGIAEDARIKATMPRRTAWHIESLLVRS